MKLDKKDFKMIGILSKDGRKSLSDMGKDLGLSHVAIRSRLKKLLESKVIKIDASISSEKLRFLNVILCLEVMDISKYINEFSTCSRIYEMIRTSGKYNLIVFFFAEDVNTLNSVLYKCRFTTDPNIKNFSVNISSSSSIRLNPLGLKNGVCSTKCSSCKEYLDDKCVGCISSDVYKGVLQTIN